MPTVQSAKADFALLLPRIHSPGMGQAHEAKVNLRPRIRDQDVPSAVPVLSQQSGEQGEHRAAAARGVLARARQRVDAGLEGGDHQLVQVQPGVAHGSLLDQGGDG
jgi:hypothetical protein